MGTLREAWVASLGSIPYTQVVHVDPQFVVLQFQGQVRPIQALMILATIGVQGQTQIVWQGEDFMIVKWKFFDGLTVS